MSADNPFTVSEQHVPGRRPQHHRPDESQHDRRCGPRTRLPDARSRTELAGPAPRSDTAKDAEILTLRHEVAVLRRTDLTRRPTRRHERWSRAVRSTTNGAEPPPDRRAGPRERAGLAITESLVVASSPRAVADRHFFTACRVKSPPRQEGVRRRWRLVTKTSSSTPWRRTYGPVGAENRVTASDDVFAASQPRRHDPDAAQHAAKWPSDSYT